MAVRTDDNIKKINKLGTALCTLWSVVTYGGRGKLAKIIRDAYVKIVEIKRDDYELGSFTGKKDKQAFLSI